MNKLFVLLSAAIVGYCFGTMSEMVIQGSLHYSSANSLMYQVGYSVVFFAICAFGMLKSAK